MESTTSITNMNSQSEEATSINQCDSVEEFIPPTLLRSFQMYLQWVKDLRFQLSELRINATQETRLLNKHQHSENDRSCDDMRLSQYQSCPFPFIQDWSELQQLGSKIFGLDQTAEQSNVQPASKGGQKRTDLKELNKSIKKTCAKGKQYEEEVNFLIAKRQDILKTTGKLTEEQKSQFKRQKQDLTRKIKENMQLVEELKQNLSQVDEEEFQLQDQGSEEETDDEDDFHHQVETGNPKSTDIGMCQSNQLAQQQSLGI